MIKELWILYKERFRRLGEALALNLLAGSILIAACASAPLLAAVAIFSRFKFWMVILLISVLIGVGMLYWKSFKIALGPERGH